jgi:hypothetical protein
LNSSLEQEVIKDILLLSSCADFYNNRRYAVLNPPPLEYSKAAFRAIGENLKKAGEKP